MTRDYLEHFISSLKRNLMELVELDCAVSDPRPQPNTFESNGLAVIIGLTGERPGFVILDTNREAARRLCGLIDGQAHSSEGDFVLHALAELANIVAGHAVTAINNAPESTHFEMTPPGLFCGDKVKVTGHRVEAEVFDADTPVGKLSVTVGFEGGVPRGR